jgi:serpin B
MALWFLGDSIPVLSSPLTGTDSRRPAAQLNFDYVITADTFYYATSPQQGRPPDGSLAAGTKVAVLRRQSSYSLVQSQGGERGYVATTALKSVVAAERAALRSQVEKVVDGSNRFAFDLYQGLRGTEGNLFCSPASISAALAMALNGTGGQTATELAKTLHLQMPEAQVNRQMRALQGSWQIKDARQGVRIEVANRLWGQEGFQFLPEFLQTTRNDYGAELGRLDFKNDAQQARRTINDWVEEHTGHKIQNLIASPKLLHDARLVLTNAIYFKGSWQTPFAKRLTKEQAFHPKDGREIKIPFMHSARHFRYAAGDDLQILQLPYGDGSFSMIALLPSSVDGLAGLEKALSAENLQAWINGLRSTEVEVFLPKFKTTSQFQLADTLKSLGMTRAFEPSADFSRMSIEKDLFLSAVIHKAFVDVNEEGTEAAAATAMMATVGAAPGPRPEPPVFRADHPFVFLIRDERTEAVLFLGRIVDPTR